MGRNKHIYFLADAAVVVASAKGRGGTWTGALENIKRQWVPLWVYDNQQAKSGNAKIVVNGGRWLPNPVGLISSLANLSELSAPEQPNKDSGRPQAGEQTSLFAAPGPDSEPAAED